MFAIIYNEKFLRFWHNKVGDVFVEATIANLSFNRDAIKFIYFPNLEENIEDFEIIDNKIKFKDSNGENKEIEGQIFFENGLMLKPC
jgi:hypothetical protein